MAGYLGTVLEVSSRKNPLGTWSESRRTPLQAAEAAAQVDLFTPTGSKEALLLQASSPAVWGADGASAELLQQPALREVLLGQRPLASFRPPQGERTTVDVQVLCGRLATTYGDSLSVMWEPDGNRLLVNLSAVERELAASGCDLELEPGDLGNEMVYRPGRPTRQFLDRLMELRQAQPKTSVASAQSRIHNVGMIAYCGTSESVAVLAESMRAWDRSLTTFGHQGVTVQILDDSPASVADQVRELVQGFASKSRFVYLGQKEKGRIRAQLAEAMTTSPAWASLGRPKEFATEVVERLFGGAGRNGPAQNRNLSVLLLQGGPALQIDHDMRPEVLTSSASEARQRQGWRGQAEGSNEPLLLNFDLLGALEPYIPQDAIVSPQLCGYEDASPLALSRGEAPQRVVLDSRPGSSRAYGEEARLWAPMLLPESYQEFFPVAPPTRDGDICLASLLTQQTGKIPDKIPVAIHHAQPTGGAWDGPGLLREFEFTRSLMGCLSEGLGERSRLDEMGRRLWNWLATPESDAKITRSLSYYLQDDQRGRAREILEAYAAALLCRQPLMEKARQLGEELRL